MRPTDTGPQLFIEQPPRFEAVQFLPHNHPDIVKWVRDKGDEAIVEVHFPHGMQPDKGEDPIIPIVRLRVDWFGNLTGKKEDQTTTVSEGWWLVHRWPLKTGIKWASVNPEAFDQMFSSAYPTVD